MIYICIICTSTKPSLLILSDEHRQILEAIVSPTLNLAKLNGFQLWICESCKCLISSVETFKNIALVGTSHLLTKLESVQNERDDQLQSAAQPAVKQDLDDLLEVKTLVKFEIEEEQVNPLQQDEAIKIEYDSDHSAPTTLTNSTEYLKSATADTATKPAVYQPPTLLLLPLTVASFTTEDKQTDNLLLRRLLNETGKLPTLTLHPPSARDSTGDASDNAKEKNTLDNAGKKDEEGHHCSDTSAKSVSQGASGDSTKNPYVWRKVRRRRPLGPVRCKDCHARFYDEAGLAKHNERFHKELHVCEICNKEFISKYKFKCHVGMHKKKAEQSVDTINPEFCCTECGIQFQTKALHKAHFNSLKHTPRDKWKFKCQTCEKLFFSNYDLKIHVNNVHLKKPKFQCPQCGKAFARPNLMKSHVDAVHEGKPKPRPHICHECGAAFITSTTLKKHLATHSDVRPYACPLCPATFKFQAALFTHNRLKHLKIKGNWKPKNKKEKKKKPKVVDDESPSEMQIQS